MISLSQLRCLDLSENDLFASQDEVLAANRSQLSTVGLFNATLTLGEATIHTTISVFWGVDDSLLSWYDSCVLCIIYDDYPKQIFVVHSTATSALHSTASPSTERSLCLPAQAHASVTITSARMV